MSGTVCVCGQTHMLLMLLMFPCSRTLKYFIMVWGSSPTANDLSDVHLHLHTNAVGTQRSNVSVTHCLHLPAPLLHLTLPSAAGAACPMLAL